MSFYDKHHCIHGRKLSAPCPSCEREAEAIAEDAAATAADAEGTCHGCVRRAEAAFRVLSLARSLTQEGKPELAARIVAALEGTS